jgi:hypothetical protein
LLISLALDRARPDTEPLASRLPSRPANPPTGADDGAVAEPDRDTTPGTAVR